MNRATTRTLPNPRMEEHKERLASIVGDIGWQALRMPAEEREGFIWLSLQRVRELYPLKYGELEPSETEELSDHLHSWTLEVVQMLEAGSRDPSWQSLWPRTLARTG